MYTLLMRKNLLLFFVLTLFALVSFTPVQPALAGGQLVSVYADPEGAVNNNGLYLRVIRVYLNPTIPCKGTTLTFHLSNSQDGDYITTGSGTATYTMPEDRGDSGCNTYAKIGSMVKGVRQLTVDARNGDTRYTGSAINVHFDGEYHSENESGGLDGYNYRSSTVDPYASNPYWNQYITPTAYPIPVGILTVTVLNQQVTLKGRNVTLKWSVLESSRPGNSVFYDIYGKYANDTEWKQLLLDQAGPSATVTIPSDIDYSLKVQGCIRKVGNCLDSNVLVLPKVEKQDGKPIIPEVTSVPANGDIIQIDELNKKVTDLESKLAESQKKQSALEKTVNDLLSWIKSRFPFFQ